jgi:hypothetical protein
LQGEVARKARPARPHPRFARRRGPLGGRIGGRGRAARRGDAGLRILRGGGRRADGGGHAYDGCGPTAGGQALGPRLLRARGPAGGSGERVSQWCSSLPGSRPAGFMKPLMAQLTMARAIVWDPGGVVG